MSKVDKSQYTKAQWNIVRESRRKEKEQRRAEKARSKLEKSIPPVEAVIPPQEPTVSSSLEVHNQDTKNYVVCLKHGSKYSSEYVNKLYNMCKRHLTVPYEFVCFTDDLRGIDANIKTITLKAVSYTHLRAHET